MENGLKSLLALVGGGAVVLAGLSGFAYWLFKQFSEKWLTARFNERLESYKHQQQKELEELRYKITSLLDRTTKLYQREFDVLPEAWGKLIEAHGHVQSVTSALQQYADLDQMTPDQLSEFLEKRPLANWEKDQIKREIRKTDYYRKIVDWQKAVEAGTTYRDFYVYLRKNGIFIREEIKADFDAISDLIHEALSEQEAHLQFPSFGPDSRKSRTKLSKESNAMLKELEKKVQARLWDSQESLRSGLRS